MADSFDLAHRSKHISVELADPREGLCCNEGIVLLGGADEAGQVYPFAEAFNERLGVFTQMRAVDEGSIAAGTGLGPDVVL